MKKEQQQCRLRYMENAHTPKGMWAFLAESVRFELTVGHPITSFQDWLLKPLGQLSVCANDTISHNKSQGRIPS